jgi:hypothetical protein
LKNTPLYQKALLQVRKWKSNSPIAVTLFEKSLENLPLYIFKGETKFSPTGYFLPSDSLVNPAELKLSALYIKNFGVFISQKRFEDSSESNQIGLLVHETLRHMQISTGLLLLSNEDLQKLTAQLMAEPRPADESLDKVLNLKDCRAAEFFQIKAEEYIQILPLI